MSAGIPVLMKKDTGLEIPGQSSCGILMFENKQTFTKIIEKEVLDNAARREHSIAARKVVEQNYSWDIIASMYLK